MNPYVHQIAIGDHDPPRISGYVAEATASVRAAFPGSQYRMWGRAEGEQFVADHVGPEAAWAFRCLQPYAYKADLLKLCLLHVHGGWYVDAGVRILRSPLPLFDGASPRLVVFRSTGSWDMPWNCSLALLYAEAGNPVFTTAIDLVVANCRDRSYGVNPLSPTMSCFGRALAHHGDQGELAIGTVVDVEGEEYVRGFAIPPFGLIAARKPDRIPVGDLVEAGLEGGNNYDVMWKACAVYGDEPPPRRPSSRLGPARRVARRFRRLLPASMLVAALLGCAGDDADTAETGTPPTTTSPSSTTTTTTAPAAPTGPAGLGAHVEQGRPYVARDLLELFLRNESDVAVDVVSFRLLDPRFAVLEPTARDVAIPPGIGPRSMPMPYGAPDCSGSGAADAAAVEVTLAGGEVVAVPVDPAGQQFLDAFHADKCQLAQIGEVVALRWSTPVTAVDAATIRLALVVERRSGDEPITVEEVGGTVVFADRLVDPGSVPVTVDPGTSRVDIQVELSAARCEAHALTESNKTFRFPVWVSIGDQPSHRVEVLPDGEPRAALEQAMQAGCFGTLD